MRTASVRLRLVYETDNFPGFLAVNRSEWADEDKTGELLIGPVSEVLLADFDGSEARYLDISGSARPA